MIWASWLFRVHPRSRGAAPFSSMPSPPSLGPSPLTRGSLEQRLVDLLLPGSIPAHAGQPGGRSHQFHEPGVHPRSRGAAPRPLIAAPTDEGPSPLTRGSLLSLLEPHHAAGSIPAHAGQPFFRQSTGRRPRVHPRSRGAANEEPEYAGHVQGPSPLTRGSPTSARAGASTVGSIPAHAGQPLKAKSLTQKQFVKERTLPTAGYPLRVSSTPSMRTG